MKNIKISKTQLEKIVNESCSLPYLNWELDKILRNHPAIEKLILGVIDAITGTLLVMADCEKKHDGKYHVGAYHSFKYVKHFDPTDRQLRITFLDDNADMDYVEFKIDHYGDIRTISIKYPVYLGGYNLVELLQYTLARYVRKEYEYLYLSVLKKYKPVTDDRCQGIDVILNSTINNDKNKIESARFFVAEGKKGSIHHGYESFKKDLENFRQYQSYMYSPIVLGSWAISSQVDFDKSLTKKAIHCGSVLSQHPSMADFIADEKFHTYFSKIYENQNYSVIPCFISRNGEHVLSLACKESETEYLVPLYEQIKEKVIEQFSEAIHQSSPISKRISKFDPDEHASDEIARFLGVASSYFYRMITHPH